MRTWTVEVVSLKWPELVHLPKPTVGDEEDEVTAGVITVADGM